jgi:1,4-dihydroxy-2-naphthoate octaprenyltransferase
MNLSSWVRAARPRTLTLSVTPVLVGSSLAWSIGSKIDVFVVLAALLGSIFIHLGTNLHNDVVDSERGGDRLDRLGPPRVTASDLLNATAVKYSAGICFGLAAIFGFYLATVGGWPIVVLGLLSILSGWAYNGGPMPIAYTPFGEVFVLAFFGIGAVCGTYWLCTGALGMAAFVSGIALGLLTSAVLLVNNFRDVIADTRAGRHTLAIVAGRTITIWIYTGFMLLPYGALPIIGRAVPDGHVWLAFATLPPTVLLIYRFIHEPPGRGFNRILLHTVRIQLLFSALLSLGLLF